ncbi:hypothetical protein Acr_14g0004570 [Actinidia rufa]|uniref:CAAX amino terminal protease family protein n=1 Tax=Actinidia rufa TaxID=165716 RepID=A0A7J0FQ30_9ERIC|nr:hypothetical protein Acr_14g0004570 [Actinidia rufa]
MDHGKILERIGFWRVLVEILSILPRPRARRRQYPGSWRADEHSDGGSGELSGDDLAKFHGLILPRSRGFGDKQPPKRSWATSSVMVLGRRACLLSHIRGIYVAMGLAGKFICSMTGIDCMGGFYPSLDAIDEVVKVSPHARAIRDVEDKELRSFFCGMSPWQFIPIVAASSVGEELFYRPLFSTDFVTDARGMATLTGVLPPYVPFAQAFAAVITAALTGSLYYMAASPEDPTYIVAPVVQSRSGREDLKKLFAALYERRQMKKIYSPLLEGLLALYLGFEWIQVTQLLPSPSFHNIQREK